MFGGFSLELANGSQVIVGRSILTGNSQEARQGSPSGDGPWQGMGLKTGKVRQIKGLLKRFLYLSCLGLSKGPSEKILYPSQSARCDTAERHQKRLKLTNEC